MEEFGRKYQRGKLVIPALLKDKNSQIIIKAVILDISAKGLRLLTNDKLFKMADPNVLMQKTFDIDFDLFDLNTEGIEGKIVNLKPGLRHQYERQIGLEFTKIEPDLARDINRLVLGELS